MNNRCMNRNRRGQSMRGQGQGRGRGRMMNMAPPVSDTLPDEMTSPVENPAESFPRQNRCGGQMRMRNRMRCGQNSDQSIAGPDMIPDSEDASGEASGQGKQRNNRNSMQYRGMGRGQRFAS